MGRVVIAVSSLFLLVIHEEIKENLEKNLLACFIFRGIMRNEENK